MWEIPKERTVSNEMKKGKSVERQRILKIIEGMRSQHHTLIDIEGLIRRIEK